MRGGRMESEVVRCTRHGESPFCWVQRDGAHVNDSHCLCLTKTLADCPVDVHRRDAGHRSEVFHLVSKKGGQK